MEERAKARKDQAQRAKELRELQLQSMLMTVATTQGRSNSERGRNEAMDEFDADDTVGSPAKQEDEDTVLANTMGQMPFRPMTAAEQRKQQLIAKRQAIAQRTQANLLKLHAEREAKIAALDAKLDKVGDAKTNA